MVVERDIRSSSSSSSSSSNSSDSEAFDEDASSPISFCSLSFRLDLLLLPPSGSAFLESFRSLTSSDSS